jgi:hypothetical protein
LNAGVREGKTFPASEKTPGVEPSGVGQLYIKWFVPMNIKGTYIIEPNGVGQLYIK